jgi:hypothetical protein
MGRFLCLLLNSGRVLTPISKHTFPPILEEKAKYPSQFLSWKFMDIYKVPSTYTTNFLQVLYKKVSLLEKLGC